MQTKPLGLLYGSQYQLGNFDQCLDPPWLLEANPQLRSQYCIADILIEGSKLRKGAEVFDPYDSAHEYLHVSLVGGRENLGAKLYKGRNQCISKYVNSLILLVTSCGR